MRRFGRLAAAALLALSASGVGAGTVAAADPVTFGQPKATSAFGKSIEFDQPVELAAVPSLVELLLRTPGAAGPNVTLVDAPTARGNQTLHFEVDLTTGHIVPNTTFTARWRVTDADGRTWLGPEVTHTYADERVNWRTLEGDVVRVHWYEGNDAFGRRALAIGDKAVAETAALLGVTETEPIDFYIYADQQQFYDALGPGTRENVGGQAHADIRTMFALITPAEIGQTWVDVVVPHELVHLVFATATDNPYNDPPHWLNEGLAVYLSEGYGRDYRNDGREGGRGRDDHPARGPGRRVPYDIRALPPGLRREHLGGRLHRSHPRPGRTLRSHPLVCDRRVRRRGLQGRARRRHGRVRGRVARESGCHGARSPRTAARPGGPGAGRLERIRTEPERGARDRIRLVPDAEPPPVRQPGRGIG